MENLGRVLSRIQEIRDRIGHIQMQPNLNATGQRAYDLDAYGRIGGFDEVLNSAIENSRATRLAKGAKRAARAPYHNMENKFEDLIAKAADKYRIDDNLIRALIEAESNFNPGARSRAGAMGLMQLMPATAKAMGVTDAFDPEQNIDGGSKYLRMMLDRFGTVELALAAYNAGPGNVRKYGGIPPFRETQAYVSRVMSRWEELSS